MKNLFLMGFVCLVISAILLLGALFSDGDMRRMLIVTTVVFISLFIISFIISTIIRIYNHAFIKKKERYRKLPEIRSRD